jgi:hypothetical protein
MFGNFIAKLENRTKAFFWWFAWDLGEELILKIT